MAKRVRHARCGLRLSPSRQEPSAHAALPGLRTATAYLQQGRSIIPKSTKPQRIAENFNVFDFELTASDLAAIDGLNTAQRGGPEPTEITLEDHGRPIPEA